MSTLRTNNLQNPDSAGVNIVMTEGGGAIFSGIVTAPTLNVTGVLTYDDVTNIDSVGVVTARSGIHVTGGSIGVGTDNPLTKTHIDGTNGDNSTLFITASDLGADYGGTISLGGNYDGTNKTAFSQIKGLKDNNTSGQYGGYLSFLTRAHGGSPSERFRITSDGKIGIGTDAPTKLITVGAAITTALFEVNPHAAGVDIGVTSGNIAPHYQTNVIFYNGQIGSGSERFRISAEGHVTAPLQPSFHATNTTIGQINTDTYGTIVFNDVTNNGNHNIGGHYNASTGVFTAPIAGRYLICARSLTNSTANSNPYVSIYVLLNGGVIAYLGHNHTDSWIMESYSGVLSLAANDTVAISVDQASAHGGQNYSSFSGHLLS